MGFSFESFDMHRRSIAGANLRLDKRERLSCTTWPSLDQCASLRLPLDTVPTSCASQPVQIEHCPWRDCSQTSTHRPIALLYLLVHFNGPCRPKISLAWVSMRNLGNTYAVCLRRQTKTALPACSVYRLRGLIIRWSSDFWQRPIRSASPLWQAKH
jgi:hypothetical protein